MNVGGMDKYGGAVGDLLPGRGLSEAAGAGGNSGGFDLGSILGGKDSGGIFGGLGILSDLGQLWGAFKQLDFMNEQLDFQKEAYAFQKEMAEKNYGNQVQSYNTRLEDRQAARLSADPEGKSNYDSLETYAAKNNLE